MPSVLLVAADIVLLGDGGLVVFRSRSIALAVSTGGKRNDAPALRAFLNRILRIILGIVLGTFTGAISRSNSGAISSTSTGNGTNTGTNFTLSISTGALLATTSQADASIALVLSGSSRVAAVDLARERADGVVVLSLATRAVDEALGAPDALGRAFHDGVVSPVGEAPLASLLERLRQVSALRRRLDAAVRLAPVGGLVAPLLWTALSKGTQSTTGDLKVEVLALYITSDVGHLEDELVPLHRFALCIVGKLGIEAGTIGVLFLTRGEGAEPKGQGRVGLVVERLHAAAHVLVASVAATLTSRIGGLGINESHAIRLADVNRSVDRSLVHCERDGKVNIKGTQKVSL